MVFKLVKAGRRIAEIKKAVDEEKHLSSYIEKSVNRRNDHPLKEDIDMLNKYVEWLRFSRSASLYFDQPSQNASGTDVVQVPRARTRLPVARVEDIIMFPERWANRHVIIEDSEISFFNSNRNGENWHVIADGTGKLVAVNPKDKVDGMGTAFAVARRTSVGKQLFLELRNFHQKP